MGERGALPALHQPSAPIPFVDPWRGRRELGWMGLHGAPCTLLHAQCPWHCQGRGQLVQMFPGGQRGTRHLLRALKGSGRASWKPADSADSKSPPSQDLVPRNHLDHFLSSARSQDLLWVPGAHAGAHHQGLWAAPARRSHFPPPCWFVSQRPGRPWGLQCRKPLQEGVAPSLSCWSLLPLPEITSRSGRAWSQGGPSCSGTGGASDSTTAPPRALGGEVGAPFAALGAHQIAPCTSPGRSVPPCKPCWASSATHWLRALTSSCPQLRPSPADLAAYLPAMRRPGLFGAWLGAILQGPWGLLSPS